VIEGYIALAKRIRQELADLEQILARAERAITALLSRPQDSEFYVDSAALNLHDLYAGLERIFRQIAATVDDNLPTGAEWHRDLLFRMNDDLPEIRPPVLSGETVSGLDEFSRFRHVARNVYTFSLGENQIVRLVSEADLSFPVPRKNWSLLPNSWSESGRTRAEYQNREDLTDSLKQIELPYHSSYKYRYDHTVYAHIIKFKMCPT